jgi:hypothetical protein
MYHWEAIPESRSAPSRRHRYSHSIQEPCESRCTLAPGLYYTKQMGDHRSR